jgi:hypothetical protein
MGSVMMLFWLMWVGLVLGGLTASLWKVIGWRGKWLQTARVRAPREGDRPVWQREWRAPLPSYVGGKYWPPPLVVTRPGNPPGPGAS